MTEIDHNDIINPVDILAERINTFTGDLRMLYPNGIFLHIDNIHPGITYNNFNIIIVQHNNAEDNNEDNWGKKRRCKEKKKHWIYPGKLCDINMNNDKYKRDKYRINKLDHTNRKTSYR
jgi:hypothetical protein